jgi:hypothetical protein
VADVDGVERATEDTDSFDPGSLRATRTTAALPTVAAKPELATATRKTVCS